MPLNTFILRYIHKIFTKEQNVKTDLIRKATNVLKCKKIFFFTRLQKQSELKISSYATEMKCSNNMGLYFIWMKHLLFLDLVSF